jgi:hypothetical protein
VLPGVPKLILVSGFRFSLVFRVYPSLSACEKSGYDELTPVEGGLYTRGHSPRQSRGLAAVIVKYGTPNRYISEDMSGFVPCWYHRWAESSLRL